MPVYRRQPQRHHYFEPAAAASILASEPFISFKGEEHGIVASRGVRNAVDAAVFQL
jgi:hypothetical protein